MIPTPPPTVTGRRAARLVAIALLTAGAVAGDSIPATASGTSAAGSAPASAIEPTPGFDGDRIRIGLILPLTGALQSAGEPVEMGYRAYIERLNAAGGVAGTYPIELVTGDSQYDPPIGIQQYNNLRDDVVMFGGVLGTPVVSAVLEQLDRDGVVAAALSFDSAWIHEPNLLPVGTPLQVRAALAVEWALTEGGADGATVCTFTQEDPFGEASLAGVQATADALGFEVAESVTYRRGDSEYSSQVSALLAAGCELVFLGATQNVTGPAIGSAIEQGLEAMWLGQTGSWTPSLAESPAADYLVEHFYYVQEGTEWGDSSVSGMADFVEAWEEYADGAAPDYYGILGWVTAKAVHQVLEQAVTDGDLTPDGIRAAMANVDVLTFDGLSGDYRYGPPEDRQPPRTASIFRVDPEAVWGLALEAFEISGTVAAELEL
jgi:ABC-type branched-subunit amino acid transport system substrate-binding protein